MPYVENHFAGIFYTIKQLPCFVSVYNESVFRVVVYKLPNVFDFYILPDISQSASIFICYFQIPAHLSKISWIYLTRNFFEDSNGNGGRYIHTCT